VAGSIIARNRIVHGWRISTAILLATAQDDMPGFLEAVREVEASLQDTPDT
jgi:uncharacterized protein YutE (UPF0331/DUF86 family)